MAKKRKTDDETPPNVRLYVGGALVGGLLIVAVAGYLAVKALPKKAPPAAAVPEPPKPEPAPAAKPDAKPAPPADPDALPAGWSRNHPDYGYRAAWPAKPAADGFTPDAAFVSKDGTTSLTAEGITYSVTRPKAAKPGDLDDLDGTLANFDALLNLAGGAGDGTQLPVKVSGRPGVETRSDGPTAKTVTRVGVVNGVLWTLKVTHPPAVAATDPRVTRFLNSFRVNPPPASGG